MTQSNAKTLLLLKPRGFCAGVVRAIDIVRIALEAFGAPIYVRKEIVHNRYVVDELSAKGAIFVDSVQEVPAGERIIYSAHGEAPDVTQVVDSPEDVEALEVPDPDRVAYLTQTTLSLDETGHVIEALRKKFPNIQGPHAQDICYATENRQTAVKDVAGECDLLLIVGSDNSSNSNRLVEVARNLGAESHLIENYRSIKPEWLENVTTVGLTAGASAPEILVQEAVTFLEEQGFTNMREIEVMPEHVRFGLPSEIVEAIGAAPAMAE